MTAVDAQRWRAVDNAHGARRALAGSIGRIGLLGAIGFGTLALAVAAVAALGRPTVAVLIPRAAVVTPHPVTAPPGKPPSTSGAVGKVTVVAPVRRVEVYNGQTGQSFLAPPSGPSDPGASAWAGSTGGVSEGSPAAASTPLEPEGPTSITTTKPPSTTTTTRPSGEPGGWGSDDGGHSGSTTTTTAGTGPTPTTTRVDE